MIITTKRFLLRPLNKDDVSYSYLSWLTIEKNPYIEYVKNHSSLEDLKTFVSSREGEKNVLFLGIFTDFGKHIGNIKYEPINVKKKIATMGILIGDLEWQGKGVASEVIKASSNYLKEVYGIKHIILGVDKNNIPAISAYKKIQFEVFEENKNEFKMQLDLE